MDPFLTPWLLLLLVLIIGTLALGAAGVWYTRRQPTLTGREGLIGKIGQARTDVGPEEEGMVFVDGELWKAYALAPVTRGGYVRVVAQRGFYLEVEPAARAGRTLPTPEMEEW